MPKKPKTPKKPKKPTYAQLKKKLDQVFSQYTRLKHSLNGMVACITCGVRKPVKEMQCGHFIPRTHLSTRWLELNNHPQCAVCNVFMKGRLEEYAAYIDRTYGYEVLRELWRLKHTIRKFSPKELEDMINTYKEQVAKMTF